MDKIGTFEDFRHFAIDKCNVSASILDSQANKPTSFIVPTVIEERPTAQRISEINVYSRLVQDRILFLNGVVNQDSCNTLVAQLLYLSSVDDRDISLYISSPGGDVVSGLSVIDTMNFIKPSVSTTCIGMAASMGAVILSNGEKGKRFVLPHSRVMIHSVSSQHGGHTADIKIEMEQTLRCQNDLYEILAKNMGKSFEEIEKMCERDKWLIGQEAIDMGIADKLITKQD